MSRVIVIIQARMGSLRLPGKVMEDISGRPLLARVLDRAKLIRGVDRVIVATTNEDRDQVLLELARRCGVEGFAGSRDDVLDRFYQAARAWCGRVVVRLTADCPLLDPEISSLVIEEFLRGGFDYVSNVHPPTFPDGLDTEVFSFQALERAWKEAALPSEREHVTPFLWKFPERFRLGTVQHRRDLSSYRWTVDRVEDLTFVRAVYDRLGHAGPAFGMSQILALLSNQPQLEALNRGITRDEGYLQSILQEQETGLNEDSVSK
jgi:spore coat polysaccharide biosynthesis protein SpsF